MSDKKTCGDWDKIIKHANDIKEGVEYFYGRFIRYRYAYRILRDEVRRLRNRPTIKAGSGERIYIDEHANLTARQWEAIQMMGVPETQTQEERE